MSTNDRTTATFDGRKIEITVGSVHALDALAKSLGYKDHTVLTCYQGGWRASSSFSGNTHGREAFDLSESEWKAKVWNARRLGIWLDHRTIADGGGSWSAAHCHGARLNLHGANCSWLDPAMSGQQREYLAGGDGLLGSRKDDDHRPRYPDVQFVDDGVHERWIAVRGTQGHNQAGGHSGDKLGPARVKGYVTGGENIATVKVNGIEYLVFQSMTFFRKSDFNVYVPGYVAKAERWVMAPRPASATIYGRVAAGPNAAKKAGSVYAAATGHAVNSIGYRIVDGVKYVSTKNGTWFTATSLKPAPTTPSVPTTPAKSFTATAVNANVIGLRMSPTKPSGISDWKVGETFAKRVPIMCAELKGRGVSVVATQEAGSATMAGQFEAGLEKAAGGSWSHYRAGDDFLGGDITETVNVLTDEHEVIGKHVVVTTPAGPGGSHNTYPVVELRHIESGIEWVVASVHAIAGAGATEDTQRGQQVTHLVPLVEAIAKGRAVLYLGDFNRAKGTGDKTGSAFKAAGYIDAEDSPCAAVHPEYDSYTGAKNPPRKNGEQLDRAFAKPGRITFRKREVMVPALVKGNYPTPFGSDHLKVLWEITVYR